MATINTDIAQKIDIIARQFDSFTIKLDMTKQDGTVYDLSNTYVAFNVYNVETEGSVLFMSNKNLGNPTIGTYFTTNNITLYDKFTTDTYTHSSLSSIFVDSGVGVITLSQSQLSIAPGAYKYKMILQTTTNIKTWMYGKFKVNE
tara:strand:+ start:288 stop:722 length:435 start_codon:yes stop_codon:yes gene_type:complete